MLPTLTGVTFGAPTKFLRLSPTQRSDYIVPAIPFYYTICCQVPADLLTAIRTWYHVLSGRSSCATMRAKSAHCNAAASRAKWQWNHCEGKGATAMSDIPNEDKPGFG